ncbi:MAG: DUF58 domain-containing protein [Micromonosporaceae bacterium]|nr:DUF58 domain-containing protein [Micromonosporaceae bacterium]
MHVTGRGYGVLVAGVLLLVAGFGFGYPELAAIGCAAVVAVLGALAFVAWRPELVVDRVADPDRVMRGESSAVTLSIHNASRFFGASLIARDRVTHGRAEATAKPAGTVAVPLIRLRPGRTTTVSYPVPTRRRGVIRVGPLEVSRRDPLGLVWVVRQYGDAVTVWVRPRVHPIVAVPVGLSRSMDGRVDRVPLGSITFASLREYVVGDDLRHVHWRTSARVGELMVREHVDTSLPRLVVLLDDRAGAHRPGSESGSGGAGEPEGTFEAACEAAASVLVAAAREDIAVELRLLSGAVASGRSEREVGPLLDLLAEAELTAESEPGRDLRSAIENLRVRRVGDTLIFLSGPPDQEALGLVASLRGAYPSIIAGVFGPIESGLATTAGMLVVSAADGADFAGAWDGVRAW